MRHLLMAIAASALWTSAATAQIDVVIQYIHVEDPAPPTLSNLDPPPEDLGLAGARIGIEDNATTGRFLGQTYDLQTHVVAAGEDPRPIAIAALEQGDLLVLDAPSEALLAIADLPEAQEALLFNTSAPDMALRSEACRANLLHTGPSLAMRTDALAQFIQTRRWEDLALIRGEHPSDIAFAEAMHGSLEKFGLGLNAEKTWAFDADMRRNAAQEVPLFTQDLGDYDLLLVADEIHDFGRYISFNTWRPRPIAGSEGLTAAGWSRVVEQWGAAQLQSRFHDAAGRDMAPGDYAAWAAIRAIGEAVTRTQSAEAATLRTYMLGPDFELAGFKGRPLTFRHWNGQLRQPIPLVHPRALVALAPLEGFLHQRNELDTLGLDAPESACTAFGAPQ